VSSREALAEAMGVEFVKTLRSEKLTDEEITAQLERSKSRILEAPAAILLCLDMEVLYKYEDAERTQGEYLMGVQSVALAGGQLLLAAHAEGLGAVWICSPLFAPVAVGKALDLPKNWQAQGLILMGYPVKAPEERPRLNIGDVTSHR
jgi:F420 biosynthesis protein FbiB-like protein